MSVKTPAQSPVRSHRASSRRVAVHDYGGYAFPVQLSRELAARGHEVLHLYSGSLSSPGGGVAADSGDPDALVVEPVLLDHIIDKTAFVRRRFDEREYGRRLAARIGSYEPEVVLSANTPLESQAPLIRLARRRGIRFVNWVQDAYGTAAYRLLRKRMGRLGGAVGRYYVRMERQQLRESDAVVLISDDFFGMTEAALVPRERIDVVPNWAPLEDIPLLDKDNAWSRRHDLSGTFNFVYSGTLGMKHDPALLLALARTFDRSESVRIVVVSEGEGADWLREHSASEGLTGLRILPFQPAESYAQLLAAGDVLVAILEPDAGTFSVPSKVLSYLCASRPLLLAVPSSNLAARTVLAAKAGVVVRPEAEELVVAASALVDADAGRLEMAAQGRAYAERTFAIGPIADRFEAVISSAGALTRS